MERTGLVARIEGELERDISLGRLPQNGCLPSEQVLARNYGVSRATAREVLLRLAARGLVVQHPGRRSRAVPLDQAVTLENLRVALHAEGPAHPEKRRLLEGFFELKREMTVELLAACCEHASEAELSKLLDISFLLGQAAHWEEPSVWAKREFELLRLAALAANRPGHFLLIQSLERSFWSMAGRVLPQLDCEAIRQWARCAFHALGERAAQTLRRELPALLQAGDERLFPPLASVHERDSLPVNLHRSDERGPEGTCESGTDRGRLPGAAHPNRSTCQILTGSREVLTAGTPLSEFTQSQLPTADAPNRSACQTGSCQALPAGGLQLESAQAELPGTICSNRSACQTGSFQAPPLGGFWPEPLATPADRPAGCEVLGEGENSVPGGTWGAHTWSPVPWGLRPGHRGYPPNTWAAVGSFA
jgi:DNA-binding FadR family transcriptional regulator